MMLLASTRTWVKAHLSWGTALKSLDLEPALYHNAHKSAEKCTALQDLPSYSEQHDHACWQI